MSQVFHRSTNTISRVSIFGAVFFVAALGWLLNTVSRSSWVTQARIARQQPVPFSHKHHVGGDGHRLPLLPHVGRDLRVRGYSADQDVHELPLADLGRQPDA